MTVLVNLVGFVGKWRLKDQIHYSDPKRSLWPVYVNEEQSCMILISVGCDEMY